jgi:O6-methylguanine-DNA--protein-cysteine methyltransferase
MRSCPIELWIPCHRIVPSGPGFGTYGDHPDRREFLLRLERAI